MVNPRIVVVASAVVLAPVCSLSAQVPPAFADAWREVRTFHRSEVEREGVVGSSLWLMHDGEVVAREHVGFADLESYRRVDENTIYHWASITKTFTGIAIMQLRDRGLLTLDDPIIDYVPELREVHNPFGDMRDITLRHLLEHSAGFRAGTWPWGGDEEWHPHEPTRWEQLVSMMPYTEILFEPGSRHRYSNPGIIFLGRVIEAVSGDPYEAYIDKNIFTPLGMHRSYFDHTPYHLLPHRSNNYLVTDGQREAQGLDFNTGITVSNGGLNAPVGDMVKYLSFLVGTRAAPVVLSRETLEEMWEIRHEIDTDDTGTTHSIGLTYFVLDRNGRRYYGHTGGQKAFVSFFYVDPSTRTAAIAAFNTLGVPAEEGHAPRPNTRRILSDLRVKLFDEIFPLFEPQRAQSP